MKAHLNFEDHGNGQVAIQLIFGAATTPFDPQSTAHQMALLAMKYLDSLLEQNGEPEVRVKDPGAETPLLEGPSFPGLIEPSTGLVGRG
jgi:hypothetical protein